MNINTAVQILTEKTKVNTLDKVDVTLFKTINIKVNNICASEWTLLLLFPSTIKATISKYKKTKQMFGF